MRPIAVIGSCLLVATCTAQATVTTYASYEAFEDQRGTDVGTFVDMVPSVGRYVLVVKKDGRDEKIACKTIWGFKYQDVLFRTEDGSHLPVRLMTQGAVCYYENGAAHLRMLRDGKEIDHFELGHLSYLSRDLVGPIVPAVFKDHDHGPSGRFRSDYPQLEPLFSCIGDLDVISQTRQCVVDFEAALEGR